jgi:hypothetical protein
MRVRWTLVRANGSVTQRASAISLVALGVAKGHIVRQRQLNSGSEPIGSGLREATLSVE